MMRRSSSNLAAHAGASPKQPLKEITSISSPVGPTIHTPYSVTFGADSTVSLTQMPASSMQGDASPLAKKPSLQQLNGLNSTMSTSSVNLVGNANASQPRYRTTSMGSTQASTKRRPSPLKPVDPKAAGAYDDLPRTFSPGFHLPSTTSSSPYRNRTLAGSVSSFQQQAQTSPSPLAVGKFPSDDSDTETEESAATGRTKGKTTSMPMPVPRVRQSTSVSSGLRELNDASSEAPRPSNVSSMSRNDVRPKPRQASAATTASATSQDSSEKTSTLRRITSFSKKHGRRLSGGWKFGQSASDAKPGFPLETVSGSPSKPEIFGDEGRPEYPPVPAANATTKTAFPSDPRRSNSVIRKKAASHEPGFREKRTGHLDTAFALSTSLNADDPANATPKKSKRRSQQDFVIPENVLAKQKDLKRDITSVKKFAGGVKG